MDRVLTYRTEIYGSLIIWIIVFHIERVVGLPYYLPIISPFIQRGNCAVDIFLFISGFCLCLSLQREYNLKKYYTKRFKRVVISYLIAAVPFFIWKSIEAFSSKRILHFFFDLSGLSFWLNGCQNVWFVHAIVAFYLITPFLYKIVRKDIRFAFLALGLIYSLNILAHYFIPFYRHSSVALMRLPIYFIGLILAYYIPHLDFKNKRAFLVLFLLLGVIFLLYFPSRGFYCWFLYGVMVIPIIWFLSSAFERSSRCIHSLFSVFGKYSLEVYLCHIMILHIIRFYQFEQSMGGWLYLFLPILSLSCSFIVSYFSDRITKMYNVNNRWHDLRSYSSRWHWETH